MKKITNFIYNGYEKIRWFSPIKYLSVLALILGLLNHLSAPLDSLYTLQHNFFTFNNILSIESFVRIAFIFCGIFGLMGNGKNTKIRSGIVGMPFIYLGIYYLQGFIRTGIHIYIIPLAICLSVGLWAIFMGIS